jgi:hypothetical protein
LHTHREACALDALLKAGPRRVAVTMSAVRQRQTVVFSAIVRESSEPAPKLVPKPVAKMASQGVLRNARRLMRTKPWLRLAMPG